MNQAKHLKAEIIVSFGVITVWKRWARHTEIANSVLQHTADIFGIAGDASI
jgi:hypothetical protein